MTWLKTGELVCDTPGCKLVFEFPGPRVEVVRAARAHGWHIYVGPSLSGKSLDSALCEACVGTARSKMAPVTRFAEEVPLFDLES